MDPQRLAQMRAKLAQVPRNMVRKAKASSKLKTLGSKQEAAPIVIRACLQGVSYTAKHIYVASALLQTAYVSANSLGTVLGCGVKGQGLGLHSDRGGTGNVYYPCRENGLLAAQAVLHRIDQVAVDLGYEDGDALLTAIEALPPLMAMPAKAAAPPEIVEGPGLVDDPNPHLPDFIMVAPPPGYDDVEEDDGRPRLMLSEENARKVDEFIDNGGLDNLEPSDEEDDEEYGNGGWDQEEDPDAAADD